MVDISEIYILETLVTWKKKQRYLDKITLYHSE